MNAFIIPLVLLLSGAIPFYYTSTIRINGSPEFTNNMQQNIRLLSENQTLGWWVVWASENNVTLQEQPTWAVGAWGAWPYNNTIGAWSGVKGSLEEATILIEEIQHLIDDAGLPPGITCSIDPWSHERALRTRLMAARLLEVSPSYIDALVLRQSFFHIQASALRSRGLYEPCQDFLPVGKYLST